MTTFIDLTEEIEQELTRDDIRADIKRAINKAIDFYNAEAFWFTKSSVSFTTIANTNNYTSANGFVAKFYKIKFVERVENSNKTFLPYIDFPSLSVLSDASPAVPRSWSVYGNTLYLYPTPSATTWTINVYYIKGYDELVLDSDTNDFLTYAPDLIGAKAKVLLAANQLRDAELKAMQEAEEMKALKRLRIQSNRKSNTVIQPWSLGFIDTPWIY